MVERTEQVRYAVVGLGWIAQAAILPAFENARANSRLTAVVSGTREKRDAVRARYDLEHALDYTELERLAEEDLADAVFLAVPNHLHEEYTVRAAEAGLHVLCEKPMAVGGAACRRMMAACTARDVRLMIAYRLHLDPANLEAMRLVRSGALGEVRLLSATNTQRVEDPEDVRLMPLERGGGTLYDIGIYCINAARYLFGAEPTEAWAAASGKGRGRFAEVPAHTTGWLRFPGDRMATFVTSFDAVTTNTFRVLGAEGSLCLEPSFAFQGRRHLSWQEHGEPHEHTFPEADQFGPELLYFSRCVLEGIDPQPGGQEGLNDVLIIEALHESVRTGRVIPLELQPPPERPDPRNGMLCTPVEEPEMVGASGPTE